MCASWVVIVIAWVGARYRRRLVHAGGPCLAPGIRYATYYRMHVEGGALCCSHLA